VTRKDQKTNQPDRPDQPDLARVPPDGADEPVWIRVAEEKALASPVVRGTPSMRPAGEDLDLSIGWDRFKKLVLAVSGRVLGLRGMQARRYGIPGQAQHGIDLAGREPDGRYTVIQCKDYHSFTAADLRRAVETFPQGRRPFGAYRFIVATSASTQATQLADELAVLQDEHPDLDVDLWGSEQINDYLRYLADVVARFWTRETAEVFCTGAPLPGVPAPPADRQEQAECIPSTPRMSSPSCGMLRASAPRIPVAPLSSTVPWLSACRTLGFAVMPLCCVDVSWTLSKRRYIELLRGRSTTCGVPSVPRTACGKF
jgi:hypothetical protein